MAVKDFHELGYSELKELGLTEAEVKEFDAAELYDGLQRTFASREIPLDDIQKKVKRLWEEKTRHAD